LGSSASSAAIGIANAAAGNWIGELCVLGAAVCYAISALYSRRVFGGMKPIVPSTGQMIASASLLIPIALIWDGMPSALPSAQSITALLILAVFCTAIAYILYYHLIDTIGATKSSMVSFLVAPFGVVYGAVFLQEPINPNSIAGLAIIIVGIVIAGGSWRSNPPETDHQRMTPELVAWLQSAAAQALLATIDTNQHLQSMSRLRRQVTSVQAAALFELATVRQLATRKFPDGDQLWFTREALEQASHGRVAQHRATQFGQRQLIADLCCGCGGDLLALATQAPCIAVDNDGTRRSHDPRQCDPTRSQRPRAHRSSGCHHLRTSR
jgi:uncharacterized membrane protein